MSREEKCLGPRASQKDLELLSRCVQREKKAWDEFVELFSALIYSEIHRSLRTHGVSPRQEYVEELYHTVFLTFIEDSTDESYPISGLAATLFYPAFVSAISQATGFYFDSMPLSNELIHRYVDE